MKKVGIKVLKPFSFRGKMRKVGETFGVNEKIANTLFLLKKAERFVKQPKTERNPQPAKRTYNTRRASVDRTSSIKPEQLSTVDVKQPDEDKEEKAND